MRNNNIKVINNLSRKSLKNNRLRNTFAIIAIALTTVLFTSLFTLGSGMANSIEEETMRQVGTSAHAGLKYLTNEEFDHIKGNPLIKEIGYSIMVGQADNDQLAKRATEIRFATENTAKWGFCYPTKGNMPKGINEVVTDTIVLDMLGVPHEIGVPITLEYTINGEEFTSDFVLSGYWEGDIVAKASMAYVSKEFINKNMAHLDQKYQKEQWLYSGLIFADIMFSSSSNIEEDIQRVITGSDYQLHDIDYGVNWAYLSSNFQLDLLMVIVILGAILFIVFTGYLIIYNIFQISVTKDIRFYGLLKTIGTTSKQIKKLVRKQAYLLSIIGIPLGLVIGYLLGIGLLPVIMKITNISYSGSSANPTIFIGATLFSLITVYISSRKPSKIASKVSPVEAVRYTGVVSLNKKKSKKSLNGARLHRMAWSNLFRNRKKNLVVITSIALSLMLLTAVYTITMGFDMDQYLSDTIVSDFTIGHVNFFTSDFRSREDMPSQQLIDQINNFDGIEENGSVYYQYISHELSEKGMNNFDDIYPYEVLEQESNIVKTALMECKDSGRISLQVYGLNEFLLDKINIIEGELDSEKFATGNYILISIPNQRQENDLKSYYNVGDKIIIKFDDESEKAYEVMALVNIPHNISVQYSTIGGLDCFLPEVEFKDQIKEPMYINYVFNVKDDQIDVIENFLKDYTSNVEPLMKYESKQTYIDSFKQLQRTYLIVGGVLCFIVGFIGILNFTNSMLTSIITRKREFAMLKSIGMTKKQLYKMLIFEGLYVALLTLGITLTVGNAFSYLVVQVLAGQIWFFDYHFSLLPMLIAAPCLLIISVLIPVVSYNGAGGQSIIEQLREIE
ncbi:ABC transporter permease [Vallitalea okinawensis]|uniref:ABC transporter permease n=1 Tax=Vallitalea okinawensis TaxID=2078660 RepID=UPI000CFE098E|nr:ABC transporter permease [Vallitalea okinawensis]